MVVKVIDQQHLKAVCDVLAETNLGYTKTELTRLLQRSGIEILPDRNDEDKNATYILKDVPKPVGSLVVLSAMAG